MKLTAYRQDELIGLLDIRLETIIGDPESADSGVDTPEDERFETEQNLEALKVKLETNNCDFTRLEKKWIIGECECRISVAEGNRDHEGVKVNGLIKSMQAVINQLS